MSTYLLQLRTCVYVRLVTCGYFHVNVLQKYVSLLGCALFVLFASRQVDAGKWYYFLVWGQYETFHCVQISKSVICKLY